MLKKMVCVLTACLMLALPALCLAQEAGYEIYTHSDGSFSFPYPEDWTLLSKETVDEIMGVASELGDEQLATLVANIKPQLEAVDMVMLMGPDADTNINAICQNAGMELTADVLLALSGTLESQLSSQLDGLSFTEEPAVVDAGSGKALLIKYAYTLAGQDLIGIQAYRPNGADFLVLTLTTTAEKADQYTEVFTYVLNGVEFQ